MPVPPTFIKNVALEIDNGYGFQNTPVSSSTKSQLQGPFIGRKVHIAKLLEFLKAEVKQGVFLVTGYRGMGKTSFVNFVLREYKTQRAELAEKKRWWITNFLRKILSFLPVLKITFTTDKVIPIHLTLAQNNPKELDILRLIVMSVFDEYRKYIVKKRRFSLYVFLDINQALKLTLIFCLVLLSPLVVWLLSGKTSYIAFLQKFVDPVISSEKYQNKGIVIAIGVLGLYLFTRFMVYWRANQKTAYNRIKWLVERCYSSLSEEDSSSGEAGVPVINIKLSRAEKRTKQYPIATTKEMEYELQVFLKKAYEEHKVEFIFVFDELDKLDVPVNRPSLYEESVYSSESNLESAYERELRERKQAIVNIITGLKNFFTTAKAQFIFIAGREMFDASLADISDRQSPISSIFTYIFNIESLLKEKDLSALRKNDNNPSLSYGVEVYLKKLLFGPDADPYDEHSLFAMAALKYKVRNGEQVPDVNKLYFTLQNFVTYLTYRSNGSPKKIIKEIHEFIKVKDNVIGLNPDQTLIYRQHKHRNDRLYLYFSYDDQYRTGFINYLYRPFLIRHGRRFKLYSDNIIVSTPYLFDHFLKFHPFAFSLSNLELIPEILSSNKTPSLREHIRQIIDYLSGSHIREIEIGLFDYKFYSRTLNEITFLSKIFEQESAALNYTLDESHLVKQHVRNKISDLRNALSRFLEGDDKSRKIAAISYLNGILGDLHFFDQQYDDAIIAYQEATRPIEGAVMTELRMLDFVTLLRNRLKAGLSYEKISSYEYALSYYSDTSDDAVRYMTYRIRPGIPGMDQPPYTDEKRDVPGSAGPTDYYSGPLSDLLQIVLQSFMSQIYLQEKRSVAGISELKLCMSLGSFLNVTGGFMHHTKRNHIIKAQAFLQAGNLFYFKNNERKPEFPIGFKDILPEDFNNRLVGLLSWDLYYCSGERQSNTSPKNERPILAMLMYLMGLYEMIAYRDTKEDIFSKACGQINIVKELLDFFQIQPTAEPDEKQNRAIYYNYTATLISGIGDCLLAAYINGADDHSFYIEEIFKTESWEASHSSVDVRPFDAYLIDGDTKKFSMQDVLRCYFLAGNYFLRQGKVSSCSFQYKKILYVLRVVLKNKTLNEKSLSEFYSLLRMTIVDQLLDFAAQNADYGERHMKNKATKLGVDPQYAANNLSNHPDTREVELLYNYIQLKTGTVEIEKVDFLVASNNSFATQYSRIQELHFYARFLMRKFEQDENTWKNLGNKMLNGTKLNDAVSFLYSLLSILQIMDIYGSDYWMGYSYIANIHFHVGKFLSEFLLSDESMARISSHLSKLMGEGFYSSLDASAHLRKALNYYGKAQRLHHAGEEYKETIADMICLEDDFNDSAYHFGAALDRYKMTNGLFRKRMDDCKMRLRRPHESAG